MKTTKNNYFYLATRDNNKKSNVYIFNPMPPTVSFGMT